MKKWMLIAGFLVCAAVITIVAVIWYAMAKASLQVIANNATHLQQQLYLTQQQIMFDYDSLSIGSYYLQPKITMHKASLHFATSSGIKRLRSEKIEFVGSFNTLDEFRILLPETFTLETPDEKVTVFPLAVIEQPLVEVRDSRRQRAEVETDSVLLDEFRFGDNQPLIIKLEQEQDKNNPPKAQLVFKPYAFVSSRWKKIRYEVYPYLNYFVDRVKGLQQHATPLP